MDNEKTFDETIKEILQILEEKKYVKARDELLKNNGG